MVVYFIKIFLVLHNEIYVVSLSRDNHLFPIPTWSTTQSAILFDTGSDFKLLS